jgi:hypothetical protein
VNLKIRKVLIRNYRNLKDVALADLSDIVVFVGPDGLEKSDLLEAIDFFFRGLDATEQVVDTIIGSRWIGSTINAPIEFTFAVELDKAELAQMLSAETFGKVEVQETNILEISRKLVNDVVSAKWQTQDIRINHTRLTEIGGLDFRSKVSDSGQIFPDSISETLAGKFKLVHALRWIQEPEEPEEERKQASFLNERILSELGKLGLLRGTLEDFENRKIEERVREFCSEMSELHFWYENMPKRAELSRQKKAREASASKDGSNELVSLYCQILKTERGAVVGLEEPEMGKHPEINRQIIHVLKKLRYHHQIFIVSHSPILIDEADLQDVWVIRGDKNETRVYKMKKSDELRSLLNEFGLRISDFLTARGLIFVETRTEKKALPVWAAKIGINFEELGLSIVPVYLKATGSCNFHVWINIAEQIGVPYYFVLNKSAAEQKLALSQKIYKKKLLPQVNLFLFDKASIEEYFPDDKMIDALEKVYDIKILESEKTLPSPKIKSIEKLIISKGKNPIGWNILVGDVIAGLMAKDQIDDEIKNILLGIRKDYTGRLGHR